MHCFFKNVQDTMDQLAQHKEDENNLMMYGQGSTLDPSGQFAYHANAEKANITYSLQVVQGEDGQNQFVAIPHTVGMENKNASTLPAEPEATQSLFSNGEIIPYNISTSNSQLPYIPASIIDSAYGTLPDPNYTVSQMEGERNAQEEKKKSSTKMSSAAHSPQGVLQAANTRMMALPKVNGNQPSDVQRRREAHKDTERRRRDKINEWIDHLSTIVPGCDKKMSKGRILAKSCEHIEELRTANTQLSEAVKNMELFQANNSQLEMEVQNLRQQNAYLQSQLQQHGVTVASERQNSH